MTGKYHEERKPTLSFYERGPGPAAFLLPPLVGKPNHALTHRINPEYTFGLKLDSIFKNTWGPGAAAYLIPQGLKVNGFFAGYMQSLRAKFPEIDKRISPPPNTYDLPIPNVYRNRAPRHVLGSRTPIIDKRISPGPIYLLPPCIGPKIPDRLAAAECTLKGDRKTKESSPSPGPIYNIVPLKKGPAFTMRPKWKDLEDLYEAGPASYTPTKCDCWKGKAPGPTMGIRYNEYTGIFRTPCEISKYENLD